MQVKQKIERVVLENHGLSVYDISFVMPRLIPKTTSGKLKQNAVRESYLLSSLDGHLVAVNDAVEEVPD